MVQVGRLELALCELAARQDGDRVGRNKPIVTNELCPHPRQQRRVRHVQDAGERHHDACDGTHEPHERKTPHGENAPGGGRSAKQCGRDGRIRTGGPLTPSQEHTLFLDIA